jgi:hypothetical protein
MITREESAVSEYALNLNIKDVNNQTNRIEFPRRVVFQEFMSVVGYCIEICYKPRVFLVVPIFGIHIVSQKHVSTLFSVFNQEEKSVTGTAEE